MKYGLFVKSLNKPPWMYKKLFNTNLAALAKGDDLLGYGLNYDYYIVKVYPL